MIAQSDGSVLQSFVSGSGVSLRKTKLDKIMHSLGGTSRDTQMEDIIPERAVVHDQGAHGTVARRDLKKKVLAVIFGFQ